MPHFARSPFDEKMDSLAVETKGKWFYGRLAGVGHPNADGSSRQAALEELEPLDELVLDPEPDNPFDKNAVRVLTPSGKQIGYLEARLAVETVRRSRKGILTQCFVSNLTGTPGRRGLVIGALTHNQ